MESPPTRPDQRQGDTEILKVSTRKRGDPPTENLKPYYPHIAKWAKSVAGSGKVVEIGSGDAVFLVYAAQSLDIHGCDILEHAGREKRRFPVVEGRLREFGLDRERYQWMEQNSPLPFASGSVAAVVSIQVLEHVGPLGLLFSETRRILKPGGQALHYFPAKEMWVEPHSRIPFLHWFPPSRHDIIRFASEGGIGKFPRYAREHRYSLAKFVKEFDHYLAKFCHFRPMKAYLEESKKQGLDAKLLPPPPLPQASWVANVAARVTSIYLIQKKEDSA
jgi:SAM-dependent methyltransferase